jgi:HPt (histidine-containing phosphotransfer) domain-containing protein
MALKKRLFALIGNKLPCSWTKTGVELSEVESVDSEGFDPQALFDRVHGDLNLLRELVDLFAAEVPGMLSRIEKAIQDGSPSEMEKASHKIKGSMLQFSAQTAANIARQLEESGQTGSMAGTGMLLEKLRKEIDVLLHTLRAMLQNSPTG